MSTVQQPPTIHLPQASQGGQNTATAVVVKAPPTLVNLPQSSTLQATVTTTLQGNQIQVQTPLGSITLQMGMTVPKGAVLTMVLTTLAPPMFQVAMVDGKPVPGALTAAQSKAAGLKGQLAQTAQPQSQPLQAGTKLSAVLLRPANAAPQGSASAASNAATSTSSPAQTSTTGAAAQAQAQAQSQPLKTASTSKATAPKLQAAQSAPPASSYGKSTVASQGAFGKAGANPQLTTLPSGSRLNVSVVRVDSPMSPLSQNVTPGAKGIAQGQVVTGTMVGRTPQGQPIIQTPNATLGLDSKAFLSDGARVTLKFESAPILPEPSSAAQRMGKVGLGLGLVNAKSWDAFGEALQTIAKLEPAQFQNIVQTALPQPGAKLSSQLIFFLNALQGGDIKGLFGDAASRALTKERPALMNQLSGDFAAMSVLADEPQSGDWRLALIPLWNGERLEQIRLYHRGSGSSGDEGGDDEDTRFVLDLELSNLGHMQIDGLMQSAKSRLDIILRTQQPLSDDMRMGLGEIAASAQDVLGLSTGLSFQARPEGFIDFPPNPPTEQGLLV